MKTVLMIIAVALTAFHASAGVFNARVYINQSTDEEKPGRKYLLLITLMHIVQSLIDVAFILEFNA